MSLGAIEKAFMSGLRSRNDDARMKTAHDLHRFVSTELREMSLKEQIKFTESFSHSIFELISSTEVHERKGGILAMASLIGLDVGNTNTQISRFSSYLKNLLPSNDIGVMEMAAETVGSLAKYSGTSVSEFVEFEMKRALEWLQSGERNESKRHAAVLILKQLACCTPTFFFQQIQQFFDCIFNAVRDSKPAIRESAVAALRAAFTVTSQRETKNSHKHQWYKQCFVECEKLYDESAYKDRKLSRDDWVHASLLIMNELLRCSNFEGEKLQWEVENLAATPQHQFLRSVQQIYHQSPIFGNVISLHRAQVHQYPFIESRTCKEIMKEEFDKICSLVMRYRNSKTVYVQQIVLTVISRLVSFDPHLFSKLYLEDTINYLLPILKTGKERTSAFYTVGCVAVSVREEILPYLPRIMDVIKVSLPTRDLTYRKQRNFVIDPAVYTCISRLARAVSSAITGEVKDLLEPMMAGGLSPTLTAALHDLAKQVPQVKKDIQDGLLKMLSGILMGHPVKTIGFQRSSSIPLSSSGSSQSLSDYHDNTNIILALRTLGSFDFQGLSLTVFVRHCADHYLISENKDVRMEAVHTCATLLTPLLYILSAHPGKSVAAMDTVVEVLNKLIIVGITDSDPDIRLCVLTNFDEKFDPHLAQAENLAALFVALNDEVFEIRELAICIIGRLSNKNPAYVMPSLRKILIQILTELEHSGIGRNKEQAAKMLRHLVSNTARLIRPYTTPIIKVLINTLKESDSHTGVMVSTLAAIGEQAVVCGSDMYPWIDQLMPTIMNLLQDPSSLQKREVALHTLGQLVESTGYVTKPYAVYPNLLNILLNFLKMEQSPVIRREALRVLGLLGALNPHKHKENLGLTSSSGDNPSVLSMSYSKNSQESKEAEYNSCEKLVSMAANTSLEDFYPAIAIATLLRIIREPSLSQHHKMVVQANMFIFKSLNIKCVPYIGQVIPAYLAVIQTAEQSLKEFLFQQLGVIIAIVKQHIRNYLDDIFEVIKEYWTVNSGLQNTIILLIQQVVTALGTEFKFYLPQIIPQILKVFIHDNSPNKGVTEKLLCALQLFGATLDDYLHLLLPPVIKLFDAQDIPLSVRKVAVETVRTITHSLDLTDFASRIIHPLVRILDSCPELRSVAMDTLCALSLQLGHKFKLFIPMVNRVLLRQKIEHRDYEMIVMKISQKTLLSDEDEDPLLMKYRKQLIAEAPELRNEIAPIRPGYNSLANLQKILNAGRRVSKEDWTEWIRKLRLELLKASPSPALRSCFALAQVYPPLAEDLFNAAFVSCWTELSEVQQDELMHSLEQALTSHDQAEITQTLLNLAEFMEHCDKGPLPMDSNKLRKEAFRCRSYAKALHYTEDDFHRKPKPETLEALIIINNKLQQPEAAAGVLRYARLHHQSDLKIQESWYEKLHDWTKALHAYEQKQENNPNDIDLTLGRMRCLDALSDWGPLYTVCQDYWPKTTSDVKQKMARMAASAAWGLGRWDNMDEYIELIPRSTYDGAFYRAVFFIHSEKYRGAQQFIEKARDILDNELTALAGESYNRAYGALVNVQLLTELEEVMQYRLCPERQSTIKQTWWLRLQGCQRNVDDWQRILQVRSLVLMPQDDMRSWLKFSTLCRKTGRFDLCWRTLVMLLGVDPSLPSQDTSFLNDPSHVPFAYLKYLWKISKKDIALELLQKFVNKTLSNCLMCLHAPEHENLRTEMSRLLAKCELKLGQWMQEIEGITETSIPNILQCYASATQHDEKWYKTWHTWALMNYEVVLHYKQKEQEEQNIRLAMTPVTPPEGAAIPGVMEQLSSDNQSSYSIQQYCTSAVSGFFKSIKLSSCNSLQDTLRLLTLWFDYGHWSVVYEALKDGISTIQIDNWLQVIPQLIARVDTPRHRVASLITQLLIDIGKSHPQALIYPLTVASKSSVVARYTAAKRVLKNMEEHSCTLVRQAKLVSEELIRVAILWHELWHEGLEEASRLYFGERNTKGMFDTLAPLHAMMEQGPKTTKEVSFHQAYGRDLLEAQEWCKKYQKSSNVKDLTQAWDLYYVVFRRISKQLPQLTSLELQYVSPELMKCQDLELSVPGIYEPNSPLISIHKVQSTLQVIASKQRPRKLSIFGSNGKEYMYLLKGHEDLRQDERVMQLFGLVNSLLDNHPETFMKNLSIQRFAIIPLSTNSGLIGWLRHCDTLHSLIRDYREKKKILLNIEHRVMLRMAPDYEHLTLMQKVEVFEHALEHTHGDDLAKILWYKSPSSEIWFDRRTNYTRSLAVMSMVGYVLGLGDRHPSNLMLDKISGKITHIDFGDCFDVAMTREKFPEKIPFRLTRMLINAMEVTGIEGNYRTTCERVLDVLRQDRDSVMAVLEAFVYDPLLNWRLMDSAVKQKNKAASSSHDRDDILDNGDLVQPPRRASQPSRGGSHSYSDQENPPAEAMNKKAIQILNRVREKLTGGDFQLVDGKCCDVSSQVDHLIKQATSHENLCQSYIGWCPFW